MDPVFVAQCLNDLSHENKIIVAVHTSRWALVYGSMRWYMVSCQSFRIKIFCHPDAVRTVRHRR
jgi:hypothetical protein